MVKHHGETYDEMWPLWPHRTGGFQHNEFLPQRSLTPIPQKKWLYNPTSFPRGLVKCYEKGGRNRRYTHSYYS